MRSMIRARPALAGLCVAVISMTACAQGGDRNLETAVSVSSGYSFTDRFSGYAEYYTMMSDIHGVRNSDVINGGFTFLTSERNQLDAYVGTGLNNSASNVYAGFGIAHLF